MYVKIESSGCCVRKGMVQVRLAMYLEPNDYKYEIHHVPENKELSIIEHDNPFHNHFIQVHSDTTDKEIMDIAEAFLNESYIKWALDLNLADAKNQPRNDALIFAKSWEVDSARINECVDRVEEIKSIIEVRRA